MFQVEIGIPYHLMQSVFATNLVTNIPATAEFNYAGAHMYIHIWGIGTRILIIPTKAITLNCSQRFEIIAIQKYTGSTLNWNLIQLYQRGDAGESINLNLPFIILRPGESIGIRLFNRAPAAQASAQISIHGFKIEQQVYDQYVSQQRKGMENAGGIY